MKNNKRQNLDVKLYMYILFAIVSPFMPSLIILPAGIEEFALQAEKHAVLVSKDYPQKKDLLLEYSDCDKQ